jgi:hypothetical protein
MPDVPHVPLPDVTCGPPCAEQHTYRLNECGLCCTEIDGGVADRSWIVACPDCKALPNKPCRRRDSTASSVSCGRRWTRYEQEQNQPPRLRTARPAICEMPHQTIEEEETCERQRVAPLPGGATEATQPRQCPDGIHSLFDPCPGDCGQPLKITDEERAAGARYHQTITTPPPDLGPEIAANIRRILADTSRRGRRPRGPATDEAQRERRNRYADAMRDRIKELTWPAPIPGGSPRGGATEYDLADVILDERDDELEQLRTELSRHKRALAAVTRYNTAVADHSCRVQAAEQARDTLGILREVMDAPERPSAAPDGSR